MKKEDFKFDRKECETGHEDYRFKVSGETKKELTEKYMEQSMVSITDCVYSKDEDVVGLKRLFSFNYDVVLCDNNELKQTLKELSA